MYYAGDFAFGQPVDLKWNSYNSLGGSVAITSLGTVRVSQDNSTTSWSLGITDTKDHLGAGDNLIRVSTGSSNTLFTAGHSYQVFRSGDTIDGQFFSATIATFSIAHRRDSVGTYAELLVAPVADGPTLPAMVQWIYQLSRTSITETATQAVLSSSNKSSIATSATTDVGGTFARAGWV